MHLDYPVEDMTRFIFARTLLEKRGIRCGIRLNVPFATGRIHRIEFRDDQADAATQALTAMEMMPESLPATVPSR